MSTIGENWIKLLRGYGPVAGNNATEAENVDSYTKLYKVERLSFRHPARDELDECLLNIDPAQRPTILITGTAGDGKTTLCYEILKELTGSQPASMAPEGIETFNLQDGSQLDLIRDLTGWRKKNADNTLTAERLTQLEEIASHAAGHSHRPTIIAVNDGQLHEVFRALPKHASENARLFFTEAIHLHSQGANKSKSLPRFRLIDLSSITSEQLMQECITAILNRPEWQCLQNESDDPLFAPESPFAANYSILSSPDMQERLCDLARLADACQFHLPIRAILMLLSNALLGLEGTKDGLLKPDAGTRKLLKNGDQRAAGAFHRNLFGLNLGINRRSKHNVYRFLASVQIGTETTNDIDELLIFGDRDEDTRDLHTTLVAHDPYGQRNPYLAHEIRDYIRGELSDLDVFLDHLADERRRVFLHADETAIKDEHLWCVTAFHHAGDFIHHFLKPVRAGVPIPGVRLNHLITGLNRIWTGAYVANTEQELFLASGLDMTTSPVSDILLQAIPKSSIKIESSRSKLPCLTIHHQGRSFSMVLTLMRFEFILRACEGAMPGSFSREACEDLMALKQRALRDLNIKEDPHVMVHMTLAPGGTVQKKHIEFN
jgi:DNA polymerase III delta prime subunit